jgi:hypothetical protein
MRFALVAVLLAAAPAAAQQAPERIPFFAADLHAATVGLPQAEGWVPIGTSSTKYPGRNWGFAGGANIYPLRFKSAAFGFGAMLISGKGTAETVAVSGAGATATTTVTRVVHTGITSVAPQVSLNFGHKLGWSYLAAGYGRSKVTSSSDAIGTVPEIVVPEAWNAALNFGGGARWFMKPHLGAGFDMRFVKLSSRSPTDTLPSAKRTQLWNISVGISIQ